MNDAEQQQLDLLNGVAKHLPGFTLAVRSKEALPRLIGERGMEIYLHIPSYGASRGKVNISGGWPDSTTASYMSPRSWGVVPYGETGDISIGVSLSRGHEAIAKEILRRFLPEYTRLYDLCLARKAETEKFENAQEASYQKIARAAGAVARARSERDRTNRMHLRIEDVYGNIDIGVSNSNMELHTIPNDIVIKILELLKK